MKAISFPNELHQGVLLLVARERKSFAYIVREAVINHLAEKGIFVHAPNPTGRGVRSDLLTPNEILESVKPPKTKG